MNWLIVAVVVLLVIAIAATLVAIQSRHQLSLANESISGVCATLINAEAAHTLEILRQTVLLHTSLSGYETQVVTQALRDYLQKSYWLVQTYRGLGAQCPQTWADVEARMTQQIQALQTAVTTAKSDPDAAMAQLTAAVQAHQDQLIAYLTTASAQAEH